MNLSTYFTSLSALEIGILILFVIYLVFDIYPTDTMAKYIDTPFGMVSVLIITLYMFISFSPVLGVIALFVAYEVIRRSAKINNRVAMIQYTPTQERKNVELAEMNPPQPTTLEEEMVATMAPIGKSSMISYQTSEFKPVAEELHGASLVM
jgi:prepilin signal peptidase PulO-like enzyme (type II secretory pathway)